MAKTVAELTDEKLEAEIHLAGVHVELSQVLMGEPGATFHLHVAERDFWKDKMERGVKARSPGMVKKLAEARGLAA